LIREQRGSNGRGIIGGQTRTRVINLAAKGMATRQSINFKEILLETKSVSY
jgi:hypothetical protein